MNIGDIVTNDLTNKDCEIVAIMNRNWFEKSPDNFNKIPKLIGNSVMLRDIKTGEFEAVYEWETTKKESK
jgi:hypothetical protein